jgi:CBS domain-containing protein
MFETLVERLSTHAPFDRADPSVVRAVVEGLRIRYVEAGDVLFREGEPHAPECYLVHKGRVRIGRNQDGIDELVDVCDEGDYFGARALLNERPYAASARAEEDTLLYVIPGKPLRWGMAQDDAVSAFFTAGFTSDLPMLGDNRLEQVNQALQRLRGAAAPELVARVEPSRDPVACASDISIQQAAWRMRSRNVGSIVVVDANGCPVGIVTDSDLRSKVVAEGRSGEEPIESIMSQPVVTVSEKVSEAQLMALMMRHGLHHFAVTEDGSPASRLVGVLSEHDLSKARGQHPTVILHEIQRAHSGEELRLWRDRTEALLRKYLEAETAMSLVARVVCEINDALIRRSIELAQAEIGPAPVPWCWLAMGSEGREEQLLRTDQDNAISFRGGESDRAYFLELGTRVVERLVEAGFRRCPGDVMASNPEWNLALDEWKDRFERWISMPDPPATMRANICFDFRPVAGDLELARELKSFVMDAVKADRGFLAFFARNAADSPPPLSFFRNEIVEKSGEHRSTFDIKARAMTPLADAARVLVYDAGIDMFGSTVDRWEQIARKEPNLERLSREAAMAYEILMRVRAREGLHRGSSGRYVHIRELNKLQRRTLRSTFSVVEDVQLMLRSRYRLDMMR